MRRSSITEPEEISKVELEYIKWKNLQGISLENEELYVVVLPRLGGKIASLKYKKKDFEVAAQYGGEEYKIPGKDPVFSEYDASGLDDAFPNIVGACVTQGQRQWKYPDHGEVWSSAFQHEIVGEQIILKFASRTLPYTYEKKISLKGSQVQIYYEIKNPGDIPFPCLWAFHGLVRYEEDMELIYGKEADSFENVLDSPELGKIGRRIPFRNQEYDFSRVPKRGSGTMVKYYADRKIHTGRCGYRYPSQGVECILEYDTKELPYLGVWITAGGFRGDYNCAMEPANGYYDDIRTAKENHSLYLLKKGKPLVFHMNIRLTEIKTGGQAWKTEVFQYGKKR